MRRLLISAVLFAALSALALTATALAVEPREQLADPVLEGRARALGAGLRCLVCRNESIDESGADLAHDVRVLLRERLTAGDTDDQAVKAIVDRYGDYVLLNPPVERATYVLWFGPPLLLFGAGAGLLLAARRRRAGSETPAVPLDAGERARLDDMMRETGT